MTAASRASSTSARAVNLAQLDGQTASGTLAIDLGLGGTLARPLVDGTAKLQDGTFTEVNSGVRLQQHPPRPPGPTGVRSGSSASTPTPPRARSRQRVGFDVEPDQRFPYTFDLKTDGARLLDSDLGRALVTSDLALEGDTAGATATGKIRVLNADLRIPSGGVKDPGRPGRRRGQERPDRGAHPRRHTRYRPWLSSPSSTSPFAAPDRVFVRGRGLEIRMGRHVRHQGNVGGPPDRRLSINFRRGFLDFSRRTVHDPDRQPHLYGRHPRRTPRWRWRQGPSARRALPPSSR